MIQFHENQWKRLLMWVKMGVEKGKLFYEKAELFGLLFSLPSYATQMCLKEKKRDCEST